eukprot:GHVU01074696.1.p1 GENE.GHVU01074696.1~~GHVU01074696.1.p1  ORF type:complete len:152 (+),score=11.42 GHVU01074696.1:102-557(+)
MCSQANLRSPYTHTHTHIHTYMYAFTGRWVDDRNVSRASLSRASLVRGGQSPGPPMSRRGAARRAREGGGRRGEASPTGAVGRGHTRKQVCTHTHKQAYTHPHTHTLSRVATCRASISAVSSPPPAHPSTLDPTTTDCRFCPGSRSGWKEC